MRAYLGPLLSTLCFLALPLAAGAQDNRFNGRITFQGAKMSGVDLATDGKYFVFGFSTGYLSIFAPDPKKYTPIEVFPAHTKAISAVLFSPDNKWVATASLDGNVKLWETYVIVQFQEESLKGKKSIFPQEKKKFAALSGAIKSLSYSPDGTSLATAGTDGTIKVWSTDTAKLSYSIAAHKGGVNAVAFSPDGKWIASAGTDKTAKIWKASAGKTPDFTLEGHDGPVLALAYSPDGKHLATGSGVAKKSGQLFVWDAETGKQEYKLGELEDVVTTLDFHPKLPRLASGGRDKKIRVWNTETKKQIYMDEHVEALIKLTFTLDGKWLGSICPDEAKIWIGSPKVSE